MDTAVLRHPTKPSGVQLAVAVPVVLGLASVRHASEALLAPPVAGRLVPAFHEKVVELGGRLPRKVATTRRAAVEEEAVASKVVADREGGPNLAGHRVEAIY